MREALRNLNGTNGMQGSLVVTPDGLPIVVNLPGGLDPESAAALTAAVGRLMGDWTQQADNEKLSIGIIEAQLARLFVAPIEWGFLVGIAQKDCPLGEVRVAVQNTAQRLNEICRRLSASMQEEEASDNSAGRK